MRDKALAFLRRDFQTQSSYRLDFVLRIGGILVSIAVFYFISQIIGTAISPTLQRYNTDYFHFALLGIAFVPFITISSSSMAQAIQEYQQNGTLEVLFLSPTPILTTLLLSTLWRYCWALAEALFYLLAADLFFQAQLNWTRIVFALLIVLLTIVANAGLGLINAGFVLVTKRASPLARLLALVTNLLAGVYYPVAVLPGLLQSLSRLIPATYALEALRQVLLLEATPADLGRMLAALVGFTLLLLPAGVVAFFYAVRWAKMDGSLAQY
jgi:ABC-2 type transport system permease protein